MDDAFGVGGVECVGDFNGEGNELIAGKRATADEMVERDAIEELHGDEGLALVLPDIVDGANVGMVESGRGLSFATETGQSLGIAGEFGGEKLEGDEAMQARVFGLVDDAHAASAEFFGDAVVRDGIGGHAGARRRMVGRGEGEVNEGAFGDESLETVAMPESKFLHPGALRNDSDLETSSSSLRNFDRADSFVLQLAFEDGSIPAAERGGALVSAGDESEDVLLGRGRITDGLVRKDELAEFTMIVGRCRPDLSFFEPSRFGDSVCVESRLQNGAAAGQNPWLMTSCE